MQLISARRGMTLIELLVVVVIFGVTVIPLLLTYRSYRTTQALFSSTEAVANQVRSAHVFARESRSQREWGIKSTGANSYVIFSLGSTGSRDEQRYSLESGVSFVNSFDIVFEIGTGETDAQYVLEIVSINGRVSRVTVGETGVVEVSHEE